MLAAKLANKREKASGDGSQSRLGSLQARALGAGGEEEEEVATLELVSTC